MMPARAFTTRATLLLALLSLGGCLSSSGGNDRGDLASTASPSRYDVEPDKPKRICESTMIGNEPKTVCY